MFLQTLNIEWGQIDPKDNRRVTTCHHQSISYFILIDGYPQRG